MLEKKKKTTAASKAKVTKKPIAKKVVEKKTVAKKPVVKKPKKASFPKAVVKGVRHSPRKSHTPARISEQEHHVKVSHLIREHDNPGFLKKLLGFFRTK